MWVGLTKTPIAETASHFSDYHNTGDVNATKDTCSAMFSDLASPQYVVPDRRAAKVYVEICETALHTH